MELHLLVEKPPVKRWHIQAAKFWMLVRLTIVVLISIQGEIRMIKKEIIQKAFQDYWKGEIDFQECFEIVERLSSRTPMIVFYAILKSPDIEFELNGGDLYVH